MSLRLKIFLVFAVFLGLIHIPYNINAQNKSKHLGLKTVVIDAGHGGKDPGALGKGKGIHEKHIVLAVAKKMGDKIKERYPDIKVIYTRSNDTFICLHERAMVARRNNADLFISIHCNGSSSTEAKGTSVHILGQNSNNKKNKTDYFERNMSVAQRENAVIVLEEDYQTKYQSFDPNSPESYISHQLQWMAYYESSLLFAAEVVDHLIKAPLVPRKLVVDQDIFQVLVEANMPAVLLELAFVTNPAEYKYLSSEAGQDEVAERLFKAFSSYKTKFDASVNVDTTAPKAVEPEPKPAPQEVDKNVSSSDSEYYSIQIMGLGRYLKDGDPALKGLSVMRVKKEGSNIYKYVTGKYSAASEAKGKLQEVKKKFPDAFVVKVTGDNVTRVN
jgi:N-acetylmuramoyl-L-alanine amidase